MLVLRDKGEGEGQPRLSIL